VTESLPPPPPAPRAPPAWGVGEAVGGALAAIFAGFLAEAVVFLATQGLSCGPQMVLASVTGELAFGAAVLLWVHYVSKAPFTALGLPKEPLRDVRVGFVGGIVLIAAGWVALLVVVLVTTAILGHSPSQPQQVPACVRGAWLWLLGPVVVLAAPLGEETLFRGFLYKGLRSRLPMAPAALLSGIVFGLVHGYWLLIPALFVVGAGLAVIYERRGSLLASMTAHATFNLFGFLVIALSR
jgi:membrane protease YdiL (CAAX protease family)